MGYRNCDVLYGYDCCGGRWKESGFTEVERYVSANIEGKFYGLAVGSDH